MKSLRVKLLVAFLAMTLIPLVSVGAFAAYESRSALIEKSGGSLQDQAEQLLDKIDATLFERYGDVQAFAFNPDAQGQRGTVTDAANFYVDAYDIYDLAVIADAATGKIIAVNTVDHEGKPLDTSALLGKDVSQEEWFSKGKALKEGTLVGAPEDDPLVGAVMKDAGPSIAFTAPIRNADGQVVRVWSNRASWERIGGQILEHQIESLQKRGVSTAEIRMLAADGTVIDSPDASEVLAANLRTSGDPAATAAKEGPGWNQENGQIVGYASSDGGAFGFSSGFTALVEQASSEAAAAANGIVWPIVIAVLVVALIVGLIAAWLSNRITAPIRRTEHALLEVAEGDLTVRVDVESEDEVGRMADALNRALQRMASAISSINGNANTLATQSAALSHVSQSLAQSAQSTKTQAEVAAAAAEQINASISQMAAGTEQMGASVQEIARATDEVTRVTTSAVQVTSETNGTVSTLGESSTRIGEVVRFITDIAEQTNLLALNATIEAARAGEAGKGFAVVAAEVKELARETADATDNISGQVDTIQTQADQVVGAMTRIEEVISRINESQATIAAAFEEQAATTSELSRAASEAATGSAEISQSVHKVADAAAEAATGAEEAERSAASLSDMAGQLQGLVTQFRF